MLALTKIRWAVVLVAVILAAGGCGERTTEEESAKVRALEEELRQTKTEVRELKKALEEMTRLVALMEKASTAALEGDVEPLRRVRREVIESWEKAKAESEYTEEEFFRDLGPAAGP